MDTQEFEAALAATAWFEQVRADARALDLGRSARFRRAAIRARRWHAECSALASADWDRVPGETLAVLIEADISMVAGLRSFAPARIHGSQRRWLYSCAAAVHAVDGGGSAEGALRALATVDALGWRAGDEVSRRLDRHIGAWAGVWRLQAEANDLDGRRESEARLHRASINRAVRDGAAFLSDSEPGDNDALTMALTLALSDLAGGRRYPSAEQAMAHALDGEMNHVHIRAANRGATQWQRRARRETLEIEMDDRPRRAVDGPPERRIGLARLRAQVLRDPKLREALKVSESGETYEDAAARLDVDPRTIGNWVRNLRQLTVEQVPGENPRSRRGRRPKN